MELQELHALSDKMRRTQFRLSWVIANLPPDPMSYTTVSTASKTIIVNVDIYNGETDEERQTNAESNLAELVRALKKGAPFGSIKKDHNSYQIEVTRTFDDDDSRVRIQADRNAVCRQIVVGKEKVLEHDPDAPKIEVERDKIEWECKPLLGVES